MRFEKNYPMTMSFLFICLLIIGTVRANELQCGINEEFRSCGSACQQNCTYTPQFCTLQCVPGCFCKSDFVRESDEKSRCVPQSQCPCPVNEFFNQCGTACPDTCANRSQSCTKQCVPGCFCKVGFIRANNQSTSPCIPLADCRKSFCDDPNAEYTDCGPSCPNTCDDELNPIQKLRICPTICQSGCFCKKGFVLGKDGKCRSPESCCQSIQAVYRKCGSICPRSCARPNNYFCLLPCLSGCFCENEFVRRTNEINSPCVHRSTCSK